MHAELVSRRCVALRLPDNLLKRIWAKCDSPIVMGLLASHVCNSIAKKTAHGIEVKERAARLEAWAIGVLDAIPPQVCSCGSSFKSRRTVVAAALAIALTATAIAIPNTTITITFAAAATGRERGLYASVPAMRCALGPSGGGPDRPGAAHENAVVP